LGDSFYDPRGGTGLSGAPHFYNTHRQAQGYQVPDLTIKEFFIMNAKSGNSVTVHYTGTLDDGTEFDTSRGREPVTFTLGSGQLISGFDTAVTGMTVGEVKEVVLSPAEAYGETNPELTQTVSQQAFPEGFEFVVGGQVMGQSPQGPVMATILELEDNEVKLDMNHPMAGKNLNFKIEVVSIEESAEGGAAASEE